MPSLILNSSGMLVIKTDGGAVKAQLGDSGTACCCGATYRQLYNCNGETTTYWVLESDVDTIPFLVWYDSGSDPLTALFVVASSATSTDPVSGGGTIITPTDPTGHELTYCCITSCDDGFGTTVWTFIDSSFTMDVSITWLNPTPGYLGRTTASGTSVPWFTCDPVSLAFAYYETQDGSDYELVCSAVPLNFTIKFNALDATDGTSIGVAGVPWPTPGKPDSGGTVFYGDGMGGLYEVSAKVNGSCWVDFHVNGDVGFAVSPTLWALLNP